MTEIVMSQKGALTLKLFIHHFHKGEKQALLKYLPKAVAKDISSINLPTTELAPLLNQPQNVVHHIHPSWIEHTLKKTALPQDPSALSKPMQSFVINTLYTHLDERPELPMEYLPPSDLATLSLTSSTLLSSLCDFLGIYDLAAELRVIVDKVSIQKIYACLNPNEIAFLKGCLQKKERLTVPKLGINMRQLDSANLHELLHQRGLLRLTKALAGQNRDLVWYISRAMDYSDGSKLFQQYDPKPIPEVTAILKSQVLQLLNYIKKIGVESE